MLFSPCKASNSKARSWHPENHSSSSLQTQLCLIDLMCIYWYSYGPFGSGSNYGFDIEENKVVKTV